MARLATIEEVTNLLSVKEAKGYQIIRKLNKELEDKGYMTITGRVPLDYLKERFNLKDDNNIE